MPPRRRRTAAPTTPVLRVGSHNVRGLGSLAKVFSVAAVWAAERLDVVLLQESHVTAARQGEVNRFFLQAAEERQEPAWQLWWGPALSACLVWRGGGGPLRPARLGRGVAAATRRPPRRRPRAPRRAGTGGHGCLPSRRSRGVGTTSRSPPPTCPAATPSRSGISLSAPRPPGRAWRRPVVGRGLELRGGPGARLSGRRRREAARQGHGGGVRGGLPRLGGQLPPAPPAAAGVLLLPQLRAGRCSPLGSHLRQRLAVRVRGRGRGGGRLCV